MRPHSSQLGDGKPGNSPVTRMSRWVSSAYNCHLELNTSKGEEPEFLRINWGALLRFSGGTPVCKMTDEQPAYQVLRRKPAQRTSSSPSEHAERVAPSVVRSQESGSPPAGTSHEPGLPSLEDGVFLVRTREDVLGERPRRDPRLRKGGKVLRTLSAVCDKTSRSASQRPATNSFKPGRDE